MCSLLVNLSDPVQQVLQHLANKCLNVNECIAILRMIMHGHGRFINPVLDEFDCCGLIQHFFSDILFVKTHNLAPSGEVLITGSMAQSVGSTRSYQ